MCVDLEILLTNLISVNYGQNVFRNGSGKLFESTIIDVIFRLIIALLHIFSLDCVGGNIYIY